MEKRENCHNSCKHDHESNEDNSHCSEIHSEKKNSNEFREIGDYMGDRDIMKDPEELKHLQEICAAFFNYKVIILVNIE